MLRAGGHRHVSLRRTQVEGGGPLPLAVQPAAVPAATTVAQRAVRVHLRPQQEGVLRQVIVAVVVARAVAMMRTLSRLVVTRSMTCTRGQLHHLDVVSELLLSLLRCIHQKWLEFDVRLVLLLLRLLRTPASLLLSGAISLGHVPVRRVRLAPVHRLQLRLWNACHGLSAFRLVRHFLGRQIDAHLGQRITDEVGGRRSRVVVATVVAVVTPVVVAVRLLHRHS